MTDEKKNETAGETATVKKAMISQPMIGKTDEEIAAARDLAVAKLRQMGYEVADTVLDFTAELLEALEVVNSPVYYLGTSIQAMSRCTTVYFLKGWNDARGCKIEHDIATAYGFEVLYEE